MNSKKKSLATDSFNFRLDPRLEETEGKVITAIRHWQEVENMGIRDIVTALVLRHLDSGETLQKPSGDRRIVAGLQRLDTEVKQIYDMLVQIRDSNPDALRRFAAAPAIPAADESDDLDDDFINTLRANKRPGMTRKDS